MVKTLNLYLSDLGFNR